VLDLRSKIVKNGNDYSIYVYAFKLLYNFYWIKMYEFISGVNFMYTGMYHYHTTIKGAYTKFDVFNYIGPTNFVDATLIGPWIDLGVKPNTQGTLKGTKYLPVNTNIQVFTQTSDSANNGNTSGWDGPYQGNQSFGMDIVSLPQRSVPAI
jgi:hypothetical protein